MKILSKRQRRVLAAQTRDKRETDRLREAERAPAEVSQFRKLTVVWDKRTLNELNRKEGKV